MTVPRLNNSQASWVISARNGFGLLIKKAVTDLRAELHGWEHYRFNQRTSESLEAGRLVGSFVTDVDPAVARQILDLPMQPNDADAATVRDYLIALLRQVWIDNECFSGKRPFGSSGWDWDLYAPLAKAGLVEAEFDGDGNFAGCHYRTADKLILAAIDQLGSVA